MANQARQAKTPASGSAIEPRSTRPVAMDTAALPTEWLTL